MTVDQRRYAERIVKERLHQPMFRARVLRAYSSTCAVCSLKHPELLDAAHIIGDTALRGVPQVTNGLALCKIPPCLLRPEPTWYHARIPGRINRELLDEVDGPMLRHGLQDMHGRMLVLPHRKAEWPSTDRLAERFAEFAAA